MWVKILLLSGLISCIEAYKILVVFPYAIRSLNILGEGFVKHLLEAGHEVTYVTVYPNNKETKNLRTIDLSNNNKILGGDSNSSTFSIRHVMDNEVPMNDVAMLQQYALLNAQITFDNENFMNLLKDTNEKFDVVIADLYESEIYAGFSALYSCPMVWSYSMGAHWLVLRLIDEPTNPAYTADYLSSNVPPFSFWQRTQELWAQIKWTWVKRTKTMPQEEELYKKTFRPLLKKRDKELPDYEALIYNASMIFANEHNAFGNIPKTPQNFRLVGGQHIEKSAKPLSQDLQTIMDNAKDGVIYFSMGSTWKSKDIPKAVTEGLLHIFGELKQTVIWKYEEDLPNAPKNLITLKWAPQQSILAHPNCLFFITHGGHLSSTEAVHFGVPIIGIPIFFDQFVNINKAAEKGYALRVPLNYDLASNLNGAIQTMLTDDTYRRKAKELSALYHARLVSPNKEIVHWVEHIVRTGGAAHLRSPALHVPSYQKIYLDLISIIAIAAVALYALMKVVISKCNVKGKKEKNN